MPQVTVNWSDGQGDPPSPRVSDIGRSAFRHRRASRSAGLVEQVDERRPRTVRRAYDGATLRAGRRRQGSYTWHEYPPMAARVMMSVDEYRHARFDGPDRDYVDGEVVERNMGELPHARVQGEVFHRLRSLSGAHYLQVLPEIRIQVSPTRVRVADVAVWRSGPIGRQIPTVAPFLVVEILSPEDRLVRLQPKIQEYLAHGVEWVWVVDPDERRALNFSPAAPGGTLVSELRTHDPDIAIPLDELLSVLEG